MSRHPRPNRKPSLKSEQSTALSAYRIMWTFVLFDLPVGTKKERKAAAKFRYSRLDSDSK